jgi:hypothetical protein
MFTLGQAAIDGDNLNFTIAIPVAEFDAAALQRLIDLLAPSDAPAVLLADATRRTKS